jgi:excisionase family DNA binding protein
MSSNLPPPAAPAAANGHAPAPLLVDARAAASMLALSPRTLWTLTKRGDIAAVKIGRAVRYSLADLAAFIERHKTAPAPNGKP